MQGKLLKRPSPTLVVAMVALFVALGGTAGAVVTAAVPLAKRALTADKAKTALVAENAKKLGGQTSTAIVQQAVQQASQTPPSTAGSLVAVKTASAGQLAPSQGREFTIACDAGQKIMGGGFSSDGSVLGLDSYPQNDTTWAVFLGNLSSSSAANVSLYATCLK